MKKKKNKKQEKQNSKNGVICPRCYTGGQSSGIRCTKCGKKVP
jgi:DNA-directed RNA polymerase subunit RPC12/RpoP